MKKSTKAYLYFIIVIIVSMFAGGLIAKALVPTGMNIGIINSIFHFSVFIPCALIYLLITRQPIKQTLRFNKTPISNILLAIVLGIVCLPIMSFLSVISQLFVPNTITGFVEKLTPLSFWMMFFTLAVTPCITEEITMRGIVLSGFDNKNKYVAAVINGFLFGIFHFNLSQFLYAFALGFLFAIMVRVTNSIFVTMVAHMTVNGLQVVISKTLAPILAKMAEKGVKQAPTFASESWAAKISTISIVGVFAIVSLALVILIVKKMEENTIKAQGVQDTYVSMRQDSEFIGNDSKVVQVVMLAIIVVIYIVRVF